MEPLYQQVGNCGRFQICHVLCLELVWFVCASSIYLMVFGSYEPPWRCHGNETLISFHHSNTTKFDLDSDGIGMHLNSTSFDPLDSDILSFNSTRDNIIDNNDNNTNSNSSVYQQKCSQYYYCHDVIIFDPPSLTLVSEFELVCDRAYIPSLIFGVQMLGMLVGSVISGQAGELFGRKLNTYTSLAVTSLAAFVSAWSTSWQMYTGLTFAIGLGAGGIITSYNLYVIEFLTPKWRGRFVAIPFWNLCLLLFACLIVGLKNWRYVHLVISSCGFLFIFSAFWISESPRWLYLHGREVEAKLVLKKIKKCNNNKNKNKYNGNNDNDGRQMDNISDIFLNLTQGTDSNGESGRKLTYLDLFLTPRLLSLTIKGAVIWFVVVMCYTTLGFSIKSFSGDYYVNLFISLASEIPFMFILGPCVNRLGRRLAMRVFMTLATLFLVACVVAYYVTDHAISGNVFKYMAFLAKGCVLLIWADLAVFTAELYPTQVRSLAMGLFNTVSRAGAVVASSIIPRDDDSTIIICFCVLSVALLVGSVAVVSFPETKDRPLVDRISQYYQDDDEEEAATRKKLDSKKKNDVADGILVSEHNAARSSL